MIIKIAVTPTAKAMLISNSQMRAERLKFGNKLRGAIGTSPVTGNPITVAIAVGSTAGLPGDRYRMAFLGRPGRDYGPVRVFGRVGAITSPKTRDSWGSEVDLESVEYDQDR